MTKAQRDRMWDDVYIRMVMQLWDKEIPLIDRDFVADPDGLWFKTRDGTWAKSDYRIPDGKGYKLVTTNAQRVAKAAASWAFVVVVEAIHNRETISHIRVEKPVSKKRTKVIPKDAT